LTSAIVISEIHAHSANSSLPQDLETCFSPEEPCDQKLIQFIASARSSLDVAIYDLTHEEIADQLIAASKRITVRIIVDQKQSKERNSLVRNLIRASSSGLQIRYGLQRGSGIMHNKFTIVDDKMIETGSFNYTRHATRYNHENQIYLRDPKVIRRFKSYFDELRAASLVTDTWEQ